ncbi:hypothetical protein KP509_23G081500 [Ceratopteris richardii]|uniref:RWP-RK domain-containing protein n=1 Tax=Ceratopteris richardii TaxID=49495 RepID=A0A8T2S1N6_CERRI|nr:hypothetical protein KP509_23G081500 [Ceratopteris richardii]
MIMNGSSAVRTRLVSGTDKAKFTVFVRGHQWSSARHTHESLQEFSKVIEKNARKLGFIKQDDKVDRLQLAESADGTDPEELDVDATLEDVLICMGKKKLVALITPRAHPELSQEKGQYALRDLQTDYGPNSRSNTLSVDISTHEAGTFSLATPTSAPSCREELCRMQNSLEVRTMDSPIISATMPMQSQASTYFVGKTPSNHLSTTVEEPPQGDFQTAMHAKGLQISISDTNLEQISSPTINLINNSYQTSAQASTNYLQNGNIMLPSIIHPSSLATPSPAELAQLLVQTSPSQYFTPGLNADTKCLSNSPFLENPSRLLNEVLELSQPQSLAPSQTFPPFNSLVPPGWINSCVKPINPMFVTGSSLKFPAPNIAVLAQFLSSQLKAFVPSTESNHSTSTLPTTNGAQLQSSTSNFVSHGTDAGMPHRTQNAGNLMDNIFLTNNNQTGDRSPCSNQDNKNCSVESEPDKDQSSSSVIDAQQNAQSQQEMIFLVNRRSKTGAGTHRLRMSELSTHFHLSVVDAAKKLGVSQTTLKKACRKFGLKRWPGRKVRSLESTINGLEHTIAVGQGAGMEELTEAQIRSEVLKLQQEMDHLVHGLPPMQAIHHDVMYMSAQIS